MEYLDRVCPVHRYMTDTSSISIAYKYSESLYPLGELMPITLKRTLVKIGGSLRLTIPPEIAEMLKVAEGDEVEFSATNGDVVIRKVKH